MHLNINKIAHVIYIACWGLMLVFMIYGFYFTYDAIWDIAGFFNEPPRIILETIKLLTSQTPIFFWMWCMLKRNSINNSLIKPLL